MVTNMGTVTVYAFTGYDIRPDKEDTRRVKAMRGKINTLDGARIIEASAEEVDTSLLNGQGYYRPKPKQN
jgi:hypothetical protein